MRRRDVGFLCVILGCGLATGRGVIRSSSPVGEPMRKVAARPEVSGRVDEAFRKSWKAQGIEPAPRADDLTIMRRLSLGLAGTVPSLEEIRRFEAMEPGRRVDAWLEELLRDRRTADHLAERLRGEAQLAIMLFPRAHAAHHQVRMAADMLGQRHDRDVAAMRQCGKARRGAPVPASGPCPWYRLSSLPEGIVPWARLMAKCPRRGPRKRAARTYRAARQVPRSARHCRRAR